MNAHHIVRPAILLALTLLAALTVGPAASTSAGLPPLAQLRCTPVPQVVRPPGVRLQVELLDADGAPLAGREVRWARAEGVSAVLTQRVSVTNADGIASTQHILPFDAGLDDLATIVAIFAGEEGHGPAACAVALHRVSEPLPTPSPR